MEMILLGVCDIDNRKQMILYSREKGKCILLNKPEDLDISLYSYFNTIRIDSNKYNQVLNVEDLGLGDINNLLENIKFASNNLKILNAPRENTVILYLEGTNNIIKSDKEYILNFRYLRNSYSFNVSDESIINHLNNSKENLHILNKYMSNSRIILIIMKNRLNKISIVKIHSIKMGLTL